jgi:hypothetical protein
VGFAGVGVEELPAAHAFEGVVGGEDALHEDSIAAGGGVDVAAAEVLAVHAFGALFAR